MNSLTFGILAFLALILGFSSPVSADVYKTVDENGNVVFTDQAPNPEAEPMELRGISIVETPEYTSRNTTPLESEDAEPSVRDLRREFRDFRLISPIADQTFWGTSNIATVAWETGAPLREGMNVVIYVNDKSSAPTTSQVIATEPLERGEHKVRAELKDGEGRTVAFTDPVTFFVKQQSALFRGGG